MLVEWLLIYTFGWFSHFLLFRVDGWSESGEVSCSSHLWMDIDIFYWSLFLIRNLSVTE